VGLPDLEVVGEWGLLAWKEGLAQKNLKEGSFVCGGDFSLPYGGSRSGTLSMKEPAWGKELGKRRETQRSGCIVVRGLLVESEEGRPQKEFNKKGSFWWEGKGALAGWGAFRGPSIIEEGRQRGREKYKR